MGWLLAWEDEGRSGLAMMMEAVSVLSPNSSSSRPLLSSGEMASRMLKYYRRMVSMVW